MNERESAHSNQRRSAQLSLPSRDLSRVYVITLLVTVTTLVFSARMLRDQLGLSQVLSISWDQGLARLQLWRFLSHPLAAPVPALGSRLQAFFFPCELLIPVLFLLGFGTRVERETGALRLARMLAFIAFTSAIFSLPMLRLWPSLGTEIGGPMVLAIGILPIYLFLFSEQRALEGALPVPLLFLVGGLALVATTVVFATSFAPVGEPPLRNQYAALTGLLAGGGAYALDDFYELFKQRRRDQAEVELVLEEVGVRATVDELLQKIHEHGMGSLTRAEKSFLRDASQRFYRQS